MKADYLPPCSCELFGIRPRAFGEGKPDWTGQVSSFFSSDLCDSILRLRSNFGPLVNKRLILSFLEVTRTSHNDITLIYSNDSFQME